MFNTKAVLRFYEYAKNPKHRYHSYTYCHDAFTKIIGINSPTEDEIDFMALNLGMYLASWGMYRGSSALLQKCSYKVHVGAIGILLNQKYRNLINISPSKFCRENITLILEVFNKLKSYYMQNQISPTDTLITKILLGTLGCTMALDTRVKSSIGRSGITQKFGKRHLSDIKMYYDSNQSEIDNAVHKVNNPKYTILKCMDMSFF